MTRILIASHGRTASGLASTLRMFVGDMDIQTIDAYVDGPDDTYDEDIASFIAGVGPGDAAYIFTDFYGGSVNKRVTTQLIGAGKRNIRLIANTNVPIMIDILTSGGLLSYEEIDEMIEEGKTRAVRIEELLCVNSDAGEDDSGFLDGV